MTKKNDGKGIWDSEKKKFVPMPKVDKGSRFYVTPAGLTPTKKGR